MKLLEKIQIPVLIHLSFDKRIKSILQTAVIGIQQDHVTLKPKGDLFCIFFFGRFITSFNKY